MSLEKQIVQTLEPLVEEIVELKKKVDGIQVIKGEKGDQGERGADAPVVTVDEVVEKLLPLVPVAKDGADGKDGVDGKDAPVVTVDEVVEKLVPHIPEAKNGVDGKDGRGIKSITTTDKSFILELDDGFETEVPLLAGEKGDTGADGLGLNTKAWAPGVHREGTFVTAALGKVYLATKDTADKPGKSEDWQRVGAWGFEWTGVKNADRQYENGDLYIDNGTTFLFWEGKGRMFAQRGEKGDAGAKGKDGIDGSTIVHVKMDAAGVHMAMSDGEVLTAEVDGMKSYVAAVADGVFEAKLMNWLEEELQNVVDEGGTPIKAFKGQFEPEKSYSIGDVVTANKSLWVCKKGSRGPMMDENWRKMYSGAGAGGGGGSSGGVVRMSQLLADGALNMNNFGLQGVAPPRAGNTGQFDATNKQYVDQAIAAGALYQGIYTVATNNPDISARADVGFVPPAANAEIAKPNAAAPGITTPGDIVTWHNWKNNGFDTFASTINVPKQLSVMLSNGVIAKANIPAATYADTNALKAALVTAFAANPEITDFFVYVNGADCWIGVETTAPLYCTAISNETGNAFPASVAGANNQVLNTYNWIVQTRNENVPEALPPGLPGLPAGTVVKNSDVLQWSSARNGFEVISGSSLTQSFSDQRYWQIQHGNMAWTDSAYDKGAIVYSTRHNAWFVATQNIPVGTIEPGGRPGTAGGAEWRKVNSTYGTHVFFGAGDYNAADTSAANNWGMPRGTYPTGQQPLNGDSYYDVKTGTITEFAVTQNAPVFNFGGTITTATTAPVATIPVTNRNDVNNWPQGIVFTRKGEYWWLSNTSGAAVAATNGVLAGVNIPNNSGVAVVWSGDPDAQNNGWSVVPFAAATLPATVRWNVTTPHAQSVPDTITPTIVYGYRRNYQITLNNTLAVDTKPVLLHHIPVTDGILHVEIRDRVATGSVYEFEIVISNGAAVNLNPIAVKAHSDHFKLLSAGWSPTLGVLLTATLTADAYGHTFDISIETQDFDLSSVQVGDGTVVDAADSSHFDASRDYPGQALIDFTKGVAAGTYTPFGVSSQVIPTDPVTGAKPVSRGSWFVTTTDATAAGWDHYTDANTWRVGMSKAAGKSSCPIPAALRISTNFFRITVNVIMEIAPTNSNYDSMFSFEDKRYRMDKSNGVYWSGGSGDAMTKTGGVIVQGDSNAFDWWDFTIEGQNASQWSLHRLFVTYELLNM